MKKLTLLAAIAVGLLTSGSQASADLLLLSPNHSFNFDLDGSNDDSLVINGNNAALANTNGVSDIAVFLGYTNGVAGAVQPVQLTNGTVTGTPGTAGFGANQGQVTFDTVTVAGATLDAVVDFSLVEISATQAQVVYDLAIDGTGIAANNGVASSFVSFDFAGDGLDSLESPGVAPGFGPGTADVQLGNQTGTTSLFGDFTLESSQTAAVDVFATVGDGPLANPVARFNNSSEQLASGVNLSFGQLSDFGFQDTDFTNLVASGVVGVNAAATSAAIPEPSTLMMAAMGLGMVAFRRRKRA